MKTAKLILGILVAGVILSLVVRDIRNSTLDFKQYQIHLTHVDRTS